MKIQTFTVPKNLGNIVEEVFIEMTLLKKK